MKSRLENSKSVWHAVILFLVCLSITFLYWKPYLNEDNYNYAVEEIHAYDSSLYAENICTEGAEYSPRLYANVFMSFLMRFSGGSWPDAALLLVRVNFILYAAAAALFAHRNAEHKKLTAGCVISAACMSGSLVSLGFILNGAVDVFLGTAIPLSLIALGCVIGERQYWDTAWVILAISEFMHVHEGIWAGAVLGTIWLAFVIADRRIEWKTLRTLPVYIGSVLLVVLPNLTHSQKIDEGLFNQIYLSRTSHHLLLSSWGSVKIIMSAFMLLGGLYVLGREYVKSEKVREIKIRVTGGILLVMLWAGLLAVEYLFTAVIPSATVITMYIPKVFKYITFLGAMVYIRYGIRYISERKYIQGLSLVLITVNLFDNGEKQSNPLYGSFIILFVVFALFEWFSLDSKIFEKSDRGLIFVLVWIIILFAVIGNRIFGEFALRRENCFIAAAVLTADIAAEEVIRKGAAVFAALCMSVLALGISTEGMRSVTGEEYVRNVSGQAVYELAEEFKNSTGKDTVYLSDPNSAYSKQDAAGFYIYSSGKRHSFFYAPVWDRQIETYTGCYG